MSKEAKEYANSKEVLVEFPYCTKTLTDAFIRELTLAFDAGDDNGYKRGRREALEECSGKLQDYAAQAHDQTGYIFICDVMEIIDQFKGKT